MMAVVGEVVDDGEVGEVVDDGEVGAVVDDGSGWGGCR